MIDFAAEARARRFVELGPAPENAHEIYGSSTHHCAICPLPRLDKCQLTCTSEREKLKLKDGVSVTIP
jgi:hypothetical protein